MPNEVMEKKLKSLIEAGSGANRIKLALDWKKQDKKVLGLICSSICEEVVYAAGMLPWRIKGTEKVNTPKALAYRADYSCSFCTSILESVLEGELDFLDGIIFVDNDQDLIRLWDVCESLKKIEFSPILHLPKQHSELAYKQMKKEINRLINLFKDIGIMSVSDESLNQAITFYNERNTLLGEIYQLRKRKVPPLSGAEVLGIINAAEVMPVEKFNKEVRTILPHLEKRDVPTIKLSPRLLVSSDMLDQPTYLSLIENAGCIVAMDDLETGGRRLIHNINNTTNDPLFNLAKYYVDGLSIHSGYWEEQIEQLISWCKEYSIDGVIEFYQTGCFPRMWRIPYLITQMKKANIPLLVVERAYHLTNTGQLATRIGAFLEMININK